ncbi:MAG: aminoglycoside phosphotransferase family protein [Alphaproteobacteria bacterium]|nr:aminoglycoside phosphotransferase family protein [Alphaproteobacteria bacterium]
MTPDEETIARCLRKASLLGAGEPMQVSPLTGGVSGDVFRVDLASGPICVKRALPRLRVAAEWLAPVTRIHNEAAWLRFAAAVVPAHVPAVLAEDMEEHLFAMTFYEPAAYPGWKPMLRDGQVDADFAASVGAIAARIHRASAVSADAPGVFATRDLFLALRIEPYLLYTATVQPRVAGQLERLAAGLSEASIALMHGDLSPKNILCGPDGPIFLDAETACFGDPAFDLAFCLNHLLLKAMWRPAHLAAYGAAFRRLSAAYLAGVDWEPAARIDGRTAQLLSAFLLARIDGKSPVEYITAEGDKAFVRGFALKLLEAGDVSLLDIVTAWEREVRAR